MKKPTILLVDCNPRSVERVLPSLLEAGYEVEVAKDGAAGLVAFRRADPDLVLLQMMLPKKAGLELCHEIRRTHPPGRPPILVLGWSSADKYRAQAAASGADAYIPGPILPEELVEICGQCLIGHGIELGFLAGGSAEILPEDTSDDPGGEEISSRLEALLPTSSREVRAPEAPWPCTPSVPERDIGRSIVESVAQDDEAMPAPRKRLSRAVGLAGAAAMVALFVAIAALRLGGSPAPKPAPPERAAETPRRPDFEAIARAAEAARERAAEANAEVTAAAATVSPPPPEDPPATRASLAVEARATRPEPAAPPRAREGPPIPAEEPAEPQRTDVIRVPPAKRLPESREARPSEPPPVFPAVIIPSRPTEVDPAAPGTADDPSTRPPGPAAVAMGALVDIADVDTPPITKSRMPPPYPHVARRERREEKVVLWLLVDETGSVSEAVPERGAARTAFVESAIRAARGWTYTPATKSGVPVRVWITVQVVFKP